MNENLIIKQNLKNVIKKSGRKSKDVIAEAGINEDLFYQYLSVDNRRIPAAWIAKIAKVLNISTDEILNLEGVTHA